MNTRQPIQPPSTPAVLSISFSASRNRFVAGLSDGIRVFRSDNCLATFDPSTTNPDSPFAGGFAIAEALDDRYIAFVSGGRSRLAKDSALVFWDCVLEKEVQRLDFAEPLKGLRLCGMWMAVILQERTVLFAHQHIAQQPTPPPEDESDSGESVVHRESGVRAPNKVHALHTTSLNTFALSCLHNDLLVLPAQAIGQIQLVPLPSGSKRVLRAHNTALRCMALSPSGNLLATASEQGTLIRVFNTKTLDQVAEFRRGVERAVIFGLAFSNGERWLASTSDKGTIHIFDLRPPPPSDSSSQMSPSSTPKDYLPPKPHRKTLSHPPTHRLSGSPGNGGLESVSGRSSPSTVTTHTATYQGSIQEYYGLRPPPVNPSSPPAMTSAVTAFKNSSWAPKVLKDVRSVASSPFHLGDEGPYWQGGASHAWTTAPGGTRKRVRNAVPPLPADPSGRPAKGVVAFAPSRADDGKADEDGAAVYVIGGGSDGRWEAFDLLPKEGGGWVLIRRGWRRYLTRQFVD
jgi:WD repeat-containing protein 45